MYIQRTGDYYVYAVKGFRDPTQCITKTTESTTADFASHTSRRLDYNKT